MNTTFSMNRLGLLISRYFIENKQRELAFWGIATIVFMLMHQAESVSMFVFIAGLVFASNSFKSFNYTPTGMHFLLIPATHTEKLVTAIILNTVYFFAAFLVTYTVGTFIGINLENLIFGHNVPVTFNLFESTNQFGQESTSLWSTFYSFAILQAVFTLGSVYFKRSGAFKTILSIFVLSFGLALLEMLMLKLMFGSFHLNGNNDFNINFPIGHELFPGMTVLGDVIKYATLPFLWIVSYFRLTEKQV